MGVKYQVLNEEGKPVSRRKCDWKKYKRKDGFSLEVWTSKGNGWIDLLSGIRRSALMPRGRQAISME